jgi:D-alanine-D-alanine ligase
MKKTVVGILFGGKSAEHEISLLSAKNVFEAIDREKFEPVLVGIDKSGRWLFLNDAQKFLLNSDDPALVSLNPSGKLTALQPETRAIIAFNNPNSFESIKIDVVFPILHGPFGEDGTIQGFLKLADIPFVGSGVLGSAIGMDKDAMKRLLRDAQIPIGKFITVKSHEKSPSFTEAASVLGKPLFVKPANMGSSVGINKVNNEDEYNAAIKEAYQYDVKIIIEENIHGREIECAVLGNEEPVASVPGEVISSHDFYSYDAKYIDKNGAVLNIPAKLDEDTKERIQKLAVKVFQTLCCEGLSRVDFFLKEDGEIIVNEINTMPGFTKISMYSKMWEASGVSYTQLITSLIELAVKRHEKERNLKTSVV